ncbi:MAG TPA: hypothetical protein VLG45_04665 [Thermodesulfobacteriota bacterium]|nr:hypothetical protein [Thermodesulfobacteriota bacterium]
MRFDNLICIYIIVGLATGCVNYQAVEDFGTGTGRFAGSYDPVFTGSYDTCLDTAEIRNIIMELGQTPASSPMTQYTSDKEKCAPYKSEAGAFNQTSLALLDFSRALGLVVKRSELKGAFENVQFVPQFSGVDENITETVTELRGHEKDVVTVNQWKDYFTSFYVQKSPQEVVLENADRLEATFALLDAFSDIYKEQLDNYERNIKLLDTLLEDSESRDALKRSFVIDRSKELDRRRAMLENYDQALDAVRVSYKSIYERSELSDPHYNDPIFQEDMKEFLIKITNLVQQSKIIS